MMKKALTAAAVFFFAFFGASCGGNSGRKAELEQLKKNGMVTTAYVVEVDSANWVYSYKFPLNNKEYSGSFHAKDSVKLKDGNMIEILFLPEHPEVSCRLVSEF